jgi:hypothetical protein
MLNASFDELHTAGCIQTGADVHPTDIVAARHQFLRMFEALSVATVNDPCRGCPAYDHGDCAAFQRFNTRSRVRQVEANDVSPTRIVQRCKECGCRIRGANHKEGSHHKSKAKKAS